MARLRQWFRDLLWRILTSDEEGLACASQEPDLGIAVARPAPERSPAVEPPAAPPPACFQPAHATPVEGKPGVWAVPTALVTLRMGQIGKALQAANIPPDLACVIAMRDVTQEMYADNLRTGFAWDRPVNGQPS